MKISVIIPAFNAISTVSKCLAALNIQTFKPHEVIIVDDGSKDNIKSGISQMRKKLKIKNLILLTQRHQGVSLARNLGAKKARGEILAFIDSDCIPPKDWLRKLNIAFVNLKIGAAGGGYSFGVNNGFWQRYSCEELAFRRRKMKRFVTTLLSNNMACRKSCFWEAGGFPKQFPVCEDMLLSYKISRQYKILWLKNNGVIHHFKNNLKEFLKHQYFFGKESTRFFLHNPEILFGGNHQGRQLHFAIITSLISIMLIPAVMFYLYSENSFWVNTLFWVSLVALIFHCFLYWGFVSYLNKRRFSALEITRAYFVSYIRDLVAAASFISGFTVYIRDKSSYNT